MSNLFCRPIASFSGLRLTRVAASLSRIVLLTLPMAHAGETMPMGPSQSGGPASTPLSRYQKWQDAPVQDWTAANDRVGEIGGWLTYLRDAQPPEGASDAGGQGHTGHSGQ